MKGLLNCCVYFALTGVLGFLAGTADFTAMRQLYLIKAISIDAAHDHILMMCGSMGCGPMEEVAAHLAESMDANTELSIICGTNEKL